ncbi:hypothetical protein HPP92_014306 [Vanilla planifolia]|uniref:Core Histone H2A/H2B/H3 domain-containing protein n=1 Tax=Vanilla planifolia TaxID=51239 RepID=A0A835QJR6_VANPL|nr:hypothetical protein HPP92_014724 [Vanilla planifolia]KAG0474620.1 hypothetical protein HPP92_014306 [Vanilla planifolia]
MVRTVDRGGDLLGIQGKPAADGKTEIEDGSKNVAPHEAEEERVEQRRRRKKKRRGRTNGGYKRYLMRVLKQVHPEMGATATAMSVMEGMMVDMFERVAEEAARLSRVARKVTLTSREIQDAVRLVLPGELAKHAIAEGVKAVTTYMDGGEEA